MDYTVSIADQLRLHLKSLRKAKGVTQAQLGELLGVGQVRIAEIERSPGAISVDQLVRLLAALDVQIVLRPSGGGEKRALAKPRTNAVGAATGKAGKRAGRPTGEW